MISQVSSLYQANTMLRESVFLAMHFSDCHNLNYTRWWWLTRSASFLEDVTSFFPFLLPLRPKEVSLFSWELGTSVISLCLLDVQAGAAASGGFVLGDTRQVECAVLQGMCSKFPTFQEGAWCLTACWDTCSRCGWCWWKRDFVQVASGVPPAVGQPAAGHV